MATGKNSYTLNVDIKQRMSNKTPRFVQYDSAQIIFKIYDNGKQYDLTPFTSAIVTHRLPDGKTIAGQAEFTELNGQRVVVYDYMGSEMEQEGNIETSVGLFVGDTQKVSIMPFNVEIVDDLGDHIDEDVEAKYSVLQVMMNEVTELNKTMTTNESTRQSNEATRRSQEIQRQTNEDTRKSNENTRISNENTRKTNEDTRQSNEITRESNEATRKTNESGRVSAENTRKTNEATRQNQESGRVSAESTRMTTENARISAEDTRKSNETARQSAETARSNTEKTRGTNEDTRKANETTRLSNEDERKTAETGRKSAEDTRVANETARISAEDTRKANEAERQKQEGIRNTAESQRLSNENSRVSAENTRESQESTRQTQESARQTNTNNAIARLDTAVNSTKLEFKAPVETKAALPTTYSNAQVGWVAQVTTGEDAGKFFRYNGSTWEFQSEIALDAVTDIQNKLHRTDRKTETLIDGVNIVDAPVASPTDIEIQGRTMVSLGNSNLEKGKYYALTDEKYKVITDGKTVSGVGKFQKGETHKTTANFAGKVYGSTTENPHIATQNWDYGLRDIVNEGNRGSEVSYNRIDKLDGTTMGYNLSSYEGALVQQYFSFNVIEQVERNLGIIPGNTTADKVEWLKNNVFSLYFRHHGYGSGPSGYKVIIDFWNNKTNAWNSANSSTPDFYSHTNSTVTLRSISMGDNITKDDKLDANGFFHAIAYAEPSDGITASTIHTDYVQFEITLKPTAQLNTRPTIVRVENFEGKVAGSTVENPHKMFGASTRDTLMMPDEFRMEGTSGFTYDTVSELGDGLLASLARDEYNGNTAVISQFLYSFNVIEAVERNIGEIPALGITGKVNWLKSNFQNIRCAVWGYGRSPKGNNFVLKAWNGNQWNPSTDAYGHTSNSVQRVVLGVTEAPYLQPDGFVHFIAHTDPSDGVVSSSVFVDYVELEIRLKPTADFRQPRVPLYEVSKEEYDRIGVTYTDEETKRRYPIVQGVQHLVNPYVVNPGENLLPPFTDPRWNLHANSTVKSAYEVEVNASAKYHANTIRIPVKPNATYIFSIGETQGYSITSLDSTGKSVEAHYNSVYRGPLVFTTHPEATYVLLAVFNNDATGIHVIREPMISPGTELKPFTPYNPSTLHAPVTLSAVRDKRDMLYQQDGRWYVRRAVREVELTGEMSWSSSIAFSGQINEKYLTVSTSEALNGNFIPHSQIVTDHNGKHLTRQITAFSPTARYTSWLHGTTFGVVLPNSEIGWPEGDANRISNGSIQRFFNGWKYVDGTTWTSVTGNGQTATAEEALSTMPTDYTPYKLSYVLAEPEVIDVTELVEGDIAISGLTQIEVGAGEIVTEDEDGNRTYTRIPDNEKHNVTAAPDNVKITYEQNIRSAHDALVNDVVQNTSLLSIHERAIVNLFARIRGLELSADEIRQDLDDLRTDFDNLPEPTPPTDGGTV